MGLGPTTFVKNQKTGKEIEIKDGHNFRFVVSDTEFNEVQDAGSIVGTSVYWRWVGVASFIKTKEGLNDLGKSLLHTGQVLIGGAIIERAFRNLGIKLPKTSSFNNVKIGGKSFSGNLDDIAKQYDEAGFKLVEDNELNKIYEVPNADGTGSFYSRLQKSTGDGEYQGDRIVNTRNTGSTTNKDYVHPDGSPVSGDVSKDERRKIGHIQAND